MTNHKPLRVRAANHTLALALGLCSLGCGGQARSANGATDKPDDAAQAPFDLDGAMQRESTGLEERVVEGPGKAWSVKVPALGEPQVSPVDAVVVVEIPVGPDASVRCQVFPETVDPAGTLYGVIKESAARVTYKTIQPAGIRLHAGMPAAAINALYLADVPGGKAAGGLKIAVHTGEERSLLCLLDDLGYAKTFEQVSAAFFSTFRAVDTSKSLATYLEIAKTRLDDVDVGFSLTRLLPGEKPGERAYLQVSASFIPASPTDILFEDNYTILKLNVKGQLQSGTWVEGRGGEVSMQMNLTHEPDGRYTYDGTVSGKPLRGRLVAPKGVATSLNTAAMLKKKLKAGIPFSETASEYHPSIDPTATVDVTYTHAKDAPARQVVVRLGERAFTAEVDKDGMPHSGWFDLGKRKLTIKRERVDGNL